MSLPTIADDVAVLIGCRDDEDKLPRFFRTLQSQILVPGRIVLVDDAGGRPDLCRAICDSFGVEYIRNDCWDGLGIPRNALQMALDSLQSKPPLYVVVSGADAYWLPNKLWQEYEEITSSNDIGAVYSNFIRVDEHFMNHRACIRMFGGGDTFPEAHKGYDIDPDLLLANCVVSDHALTRYECYGLIGYTYRPDAHRNFMYDLWLRISERYRIRFLSTFASYYWQHGSNISLKWDYQSAEFLSYRARVIDDAKARRGIR